MSHTYTKAETDLFNGNIDFVNDDIRAALVMTNTTADTEKNPDFMNGFTTIDEMDGTNYARVALTGKSVIQDNPNERAEFHADNPVFPLLGAGTRDVAGVVLYKHVTDDTDSIPVAFNDSAFPYTASGVDLRIVFNAEGAIHT